jgi:hypothetical protein
MARQSGTSDTNFMNILPVRVDLNKNGLGLPLLVEAQAREAGDGRRHDEARRHPEGLLHHAVICNSGREAAGICNHAGERGTECEPGLLHREDQRGCDDLIARLCAAHDPMRDERPTLTDARSERDNGRDQDQNCDRT